MIMRLQQPSDKKAMSFKQPESLRDGFTGALWCTQDERKLRELIKQAPESADSEGLRVVWICCFIIEYHSRFIRHELRV